MAQGERKSIESMLPVAQRTLVVTGIVALVIALGLLLWAAVDVLLLIFGGVLLASFLRGVSNLLSEYTRLPQGWSLAIVVLALAAVLGLGGWFLGSEVASQMSELARSLTETVKQLQLRLEQTEVGKQILALSSVKQIAPNRIDWLGRITGTFSTTLGVVANFVIIVFIGLYIAADPELYRQGLLRLIPRRGRNRAGELLEALSAALRGWMVGQLFSMAVVGAATTLGLWLLGIPLALALGTIAFSLTFVPYLGPIVAAVPAVLMALTIGPMDAVYVGLLYVGVQSVEGYLLTPLVQQRYINLPPAVTIVAQMLAGVLVGPLGIVFATPLAACALVLVQKLFVVDVLGEAES